MSNRNRIIHVYASAARICRDEYGLHETVESVREYCMAAGDDILARLTSRDLADEIADYCGVFDVRYEGIDGRAV